MPGIRVVLAAVTGTWLLLGSLLLSASPASATIALTPISTGFNGLIGIDHHEPTNRVVVSVNYPSGLPHNFELIDADGTRTPFSAIAGFTNEVKIGTVREGPCQGGFAAGEMFTGTGVPGVIARISPDGTTVQNPWVTLPGESGLMRGGLFQDRYCVAGGALIVATTAGNVWLVDSAGTSFRIAVLGTHLEGLTTVPPDSTRYGPWAGKILVGAEQVGCVYDISILPAVLPQCWSLGIDPEDLDIVPANENFFGVDFGNQILWGAPPSELAAIVGDVLVAQESPGLLFDVHWDGASFQVNEVASVAQWEHVTFSTAGIQEIPPVRSECPLSQGFWKNHEEEWPVDSLVLGDENYSKEELLDLLRTPVRGDASLILAHQLIAAKLNVANGSDPTPITQAIADSDGLLSGFSGILPYAVRPSSDTGRAMGANASVLDEYNNNLLTPNCGGTEGDADPGSAVDPLATPENGGVSEVLGTFLLALFVSASPFLVRERHRTR